MKKWRTLLTVKLTNDAIMQLSYCPPLFPISPVLSYPSLDRQVSPRFPPILPCIVYVVHVPSYHMYISLFYYSSFWGPVPERPMSANPGLKFYSAIAFYLQYLSWCCVVLAGSQSNSTTIPDILCSHYVFIDKRPRLKICLILELNLTILRGTVPFYICPLLPWIKSLYSHISPYPSTYTLYSLVSSLYSHISLCPSTSTLYSLVSTLYSHISPYPSTYTLYSPVTSLYSHISPTLYIYPLLPWIVFVLPIYPRTLLHLPSTPLYRLCTPIYPRTLLHIPSTPFYRLCTSDISPYPSTYTLFYPIVFVLPHIPVPSTYTLYSLVSSLYFHISPCPSTYPLYPLVSSLFSHISPYPSTHTLSSLLSSLFSHISPYPSASTLYSLVSSLYFHISPCLLHIPSTLLYFPVLLFIPVAFYVFSLFSCYLSSNNTLTNLQDNSLGNSSVKPRSKRSYHHRHSTKLSIKDLALELAKKHVSTVDCLDNSNFPLTRTSKSHFLWISPYVLVIFTRWTRTRITPVLR